MDRFTPQHEDLAGRDKTSRASCGLETKKVVRDAGSHLEAAKHSVGLETTVQKQPGFARECREKSTTGLCVMRSRLDGFGCFANVRFPKNSAIAEYAGERISHREAMRRMGGTRGNRICELDVDCYVDGRVNGNSTQYINHSCEPNADVLVIDKFLIVFALQEILPGDEITVDYLNSFASDRTVCHCRTTSCRQRTQHKAA